MDRRRSASDAKIKREPSTAHVITNTEAFLNRIRPALRTFYWTLAVRGVSDISTAEQTFQSQIYIEYYIPLNDEEKSELAAFVKDGGASTHWRPKLRPNLCFMND